MLNRNWFQELFENSSVGRRASRKHRKRSCQKKQRTNLRVETLESRIVLSGTSLIEPVFDTVNVAPSSVSSGKVEGFDTDEDGDTEGADFLVWQRGLGSVTSTSDLASWQEGYGVRATARMV